MRIGIDFDNTIVKYDNLFKEVAITEGFIKESWNGNGKTVLRNHLRRQPDGETTWMKLQGLVYGKHMLGAEMMQGVANFFLSCNIRDHKIFIVSHKTEYGHFDPEKISLRREALKWMKTKYFFDPQYFGLDMENVFFADTREEKVNIISHLNCAWFIDDLPEVFEEKLFPPETKKILFGSYKPELFHNTTILNSWRKIFEKILGQTTNKDITAWSKLVLDEPIKEIKKILGRGNSTVYKIDVRGEKSYFLKHYPDQIVDNRPRLETEYKALQMLYENDIKNVPKRIEKNRDLNLGVYEWINGKKVDNPIVDDLDQAVQFAEKLYILSKQIDSNQIGIASEACLSAYELVNQIENRYSRLNAQSDEHIELAIFLEEVFDPLWKKVKIESTSLWPEESRMQNLPRNKQTLSPSDFGFHNCLKQNDGSLTFIDFDYFGLDDPVKLTADFIWHPGMKLNPELIKKWKEAMLDIFSSDPVFETRFSAAMPLYGLRWSMIVINEFIPGFAKRRKNAGEAESYDLDKSRELQLKKAKHYCEIVKTMTPQVTYA
jgi:thiamine kinase-like enzyme